MASTWIATIKTEVAKLKKAKYEGKDLMKKAIANAKKAYKPAKK